MKAIVQNEYGSSEVLELADMDRPVPGDDEVLVRVRASALHAGDYFAMRGTPYLVRLSSGWPRPRNYIPGYDVAGQVETAGKKVDQFQPNDEILGACTGGCAEYVCVRANRLLPKPAGLTFEQAAAVPTSGFAALHGLRDAGKLRPGQKVLIIGASGGVGTFAVQIARALGAEVTGVCSTKNVELVRSIGADHVIDYTEEDFTRSGERYDLILDQAASHSLADCRRTLGPGGTHIPNSGRGGTSYVFRAFVGSVFVRQQGRPYLSIPNKEDLALLSELIEAGRVTPVIARCYPLSQTPEAFRYLETGHPGGKVVITVGRDGIRFVEHEAG